MTEVRERLGRLRVHKESTGSCSPSSLYNKFMGSLQIDMLLLWFLATTVFSTEHSIIQPTSPSFFSKQMKSIQQEPVAQHALFNLSTSNFQQQSQKMKPMPGTHKSLTLDSLWSQYVDFTEPSSGFESTDLDLSMEMCSQMQRFRSRGGLTVHRCCASST